MTTTSPTRNLACPDWCTGGHVDADVDIDGSVYHPGPSFGELSFAGTVRPDGTVHLAASCQDFGTWATEQTPANLRQLAADALAAAEWLETQR